MSVTRFLEDIPISDIQEVKEKSAKNELYSNMYDIHDGINFEQELLTIFFSKSLSI